MTLSCFNKPFLLAIQDYLQNLVLPLFTEVTVEEQTTHVLVIRSDLAHVLNATIPNKVLVCFGMLFYVIGLFADQCSHVHRSSYHGECLQKIWTKPLHLD